MAEQKEEKKQGRIIQVLGDEEKLVELLGALVIWSDWKFVKIEDQKDWKTSAKAIYTDETKKEQASVSISAMITEALKAKGWEKMTVNRWEEVSTACGSVTMQRSIEMWNPTQVNALAQAILNQVKQNPKKEKN